MKYNDEILNKLVEIGNSDFWKTTIEFMKQGGIHINPKNKGKFTASAKRAGMSVQEFAKHVLANKDKYSTTQIRRAVFAKNSKKFKHQSGGEITPVMHRVRANDSRTSAESTLVENEILNTQKKMLKIERDKGIQSSPYYIQYLEDQEITIPGIGRAPKNMLDSIAVNAKKAGVSLRDALGLVGLETVFGAAPTTSIQAWKKEFENTHGRTPTNEELKARSRYVLNSSFARNMGGIHAQFLINDHEYTTRGWEQSPKYKQKLQNIKSPLQHGFTLYKLGLYNSGDPEHTKNVQQKGDAIMNTDVVKEWFKNSKHTK